MGVFGLVVITVAMLGTAFLSGIFGMAGGLILVGVLLAAFPVPEAMMLHAVTQMTSNVWRGSLWHRYVKWRAVFVFLCGSFSAFGAWSLWRYVPSTPAAFLLLGLSTFAIRLMPSHVKPDPMKVRYGVPYGAACMALMLLTGVTGPLIDTYFLSGGLDRRSVIATKAACQVVAHCLKLLYFGTVVSAAASSKLVTVGVAIAATIIGTLAARPVLERLSDTQYRQWSNHIISLTGLSYLAASGALFLRPLWQG